MYNTAATISQGAKMDTDAKVPKTKLLLNWTAPYKVLVVVLCSSADTSNGSPLSAKLLHLDFPSDTPGADARRRVSAQRYKPCANPDDSGDMPNYLPPGLTQYQVCAQQLLQEILPVPRHSRRRFDFSSKTPSEEDHRTPIGSRSRWGHRGDVRDALDGSV